MTRNNRPEQVTKNSDTPAAHGRRGPIPLGLILAHMMLAAGDNHKKLGQALHGITRYRGHSFFRPHSKARLCATKGTSRLLDYGGKGRPVLFVPSLVNPAYILDLLPENSLIGYLRETGHRVFLLDWGAPGKAEHGFGLDDYVKRLRQMIAAASKQAESSLAVVGYCMGGTLALAAAREQQSLIERMAFLAAPWDFHMADGGAHHRLLAASALPLVPIITEMGTAPVDLIQCFFAGLDPSAALKKFARFSELQKDTNAERLFVAVEDWANSGPALAAPLAVEVLRDWYAFNLPGRTLWQTSGRIVDPGQIRTSCFCAVPKADKIVPPSGAIGLAGITNPHTLVRPNSGHVGMVVGKGAKDELWAPLSQWLHQKL